MAARVFRFSISPEGAEQVRRVLELDGRASLRDLHHELGRAFAIPPSKAGYAFFTSGRAWDESSMYVDPRAEGRPANKALLFRLGLEPGQELAYLLGFEVERHFTVRVVSIVEAAQPLPTPVLVESVGELSAELLKEPEPAADVAPAEIAALVDLAESFLELHDALQPYEEELATARAHSEPWEELAELSDLEAFKKSAAAPPLETVRVALPAFQAAAKSGLELVRAFDGQNERFVKVDEWLLEDGLAPRLLDLPLSLSLIGDYDSALALCRAMSFIDPDLCGGDVAVILARAGRREEALAQVEQNLSVAKDEALAEAKAGDTHRALGDLAAAEAYYRRSLAVSRVPSDRLHALLRLVACLMDGGRDAEANELLARERPRKQEDSALPAVGRNEPCPCGSGKKYKKCHGV